MISLCSLLLLLCATQAAPPAPDPKPAKPAPAPKREMVCRPAHDGTCLACKDCSKCKRCNSGGGPCSVCIKRSK